MPDQVLQIAMGCCAVEPSQRPSFQSVADRLASYAGVVGGDVRPRGRIQSGAVVASFKDRFREKSKGSSSSSSGAVPASPRPFPGLLPLLPARDSKDCKPRAVTAGGCRRRGGFHRHRHRWLAAHPRARQAAPRTFTESPTRVSHSAAVTRPTDRPFSGPVCGRYTTDRPTLSLQGTPIPRWED